MMNIQLGVVIVVLLAAVSYAGYRIYKALTDVNEACKGCALAEKCTKKRKNRENIWLNKKISVPLHPHSRKGSVP